MYKLVCGNPRRPALILLHGFLGVKEDWLDCIDFLRKDYYCIAYDLPGHGESAYAEDICSRIEAEIAQHDRPIIAGYSMGGRIALRLQRSARAVIALGAHLGLATDEEKKKRLADDEIWCEKLLNLPIEAFLMEWYAQPIFHSGTTNPALAQLIIKRRMKQNPFHLAQVLREMTLAKQPQIRSFDRPSLFLYGEYDLKYQKLYSTLPETVAVRRVNGAGHPVHVQKPKECAEIMMKWLGSVHSLGEIDANA